MGLNGKLRQLDGGKAKIQAEIDDVTAQLDQANILNSSMEKKARQFDRIVKEWKGKADSLSMDLDVAQKESRNASSELFRVKSAKEEDPSMKLTKSENDWKLKRWNFKLLSKRLKV